jgi:antitoxin FitA
MAQLIVRNIESKVIRKLKQRAAAHCVSMEEEHRRILRHALLPQSRKDRPSFMAHLLSMPDIGSDKIYCREKDYGRGTCDSLTPRPKGPIQLEPRAKRRRSAALGSSLKTNISPERAIQTRARVDVSNQSMALPSATSTLPQHHAVDTALNLRTNL